jgi:ankyrin repeat protein
VVVTGSRISRRAQAQRAAQASKLRDAAAAGKTDEVQGLLDQGIYVDTPDAKGITALMKSIQANQPETAGLLVRYGANLDKQDSDGVSARDRALKQADPELNQALGLGQ